ncbi:MAG: hypothetical protein A3J49_09735 [Gallionellales bacterium RIFCSPHIGHO2_02_FULL_57_16]|nr:MAG: hypothetical protein A3J49_09735 [Gallionellales bacterium RIFCSPHIGHO2_02_FULL_57_16]
MRNLPGGYEVATVACHTELSNLSQDLLKLYFANTPFEKSIFVYSQNLWTTLWMVLRDSTLKWRGIWVLVAPLIFYMAIIAIKNSLLS